MKWAHTIKAVAFDMDGLLVNTETLYTQVSDIILMRRGKRFSLELKRKMMGLKAAEAFRVMIDQENLTDSVDVLQRETKSEFEKILADQLCLLPGVHVLLDLLDAKGIPRCIATSSSSEFAARVLELTKIRSRFDFVVTAELVAQGKPAPDIYHLAAQRLEVEPNNMLVLEDSQHGCAAGVAAGACSIAVPGEHSLDHDFTGSFLVADSLDDPRIAAQF
ncbi:MAG: HAD-IA family hydrolase [Planctomycetota bacterium]